ncbi:MAG TPA: DUF4388 domain-containing protein [Vicinamibacteria bacterium]|jgi:hypothetical protein|nr:DUF4388 domain-containing protein [Vicinamibacteria bacterium]
MTPPDLDPPTEADDELTIRGDIETSSVPELLRSLLGSGETGVLTFRNAEVTKQILIQNGRIVYATSSSPDERLGENLLLRGRITARQYVEASKMIRPGRKLGAILVELDALEPEELIPAIEQQVKDILMDLFNWTHGSYELVIKDVDPQDLVTINLSTENLILEGVRRCRSWSQVLRGIGTIESVPFPTGNTEILYKLELGEEEQEVLSHANGRSTVEQICQVSYLSNFDSCRILWALQVLGIVRREHKGEAAAVGEGMRNKERELDLESVVEKFNQMFARIYAFLKGRIGDQVDAFMDGVLEEVSRQYGTLFGGVDLKHYGRADFEQMLANVADLPPEQRKSLMVAGLNELVFIIQLAVRTQRGQQEEAVVSGIIKDGFRRLGAA